MSRARRVFRARARAKRQAVSLVAGYCSARGSHECKVLGRECPEGALHVGIWWGQPRNTRVLVLCLAITEIRSIIEAQLPAGIRIVLGSVGIYACDQSKKEILPVGLGLDPQLFKLEPGIFNLNRKP